MATEEVRTHERGEELLLIPNQNPWSLVNLELQKSTSICECRTRAMVGCRSKVAPQLLNTRVQRILKAGARNSQHICEDRKAAT